MEWVNAYRTFEICEAYLRSSHLCLGVPALLAYGNVSARGQDDSPGPLHADDTVIALSIWTHKLSPNVRDIDWCTEGSCSGILRVQLRTQAALLQGFRQETIRKLKHAHHKQTHLSQLISGDRKVKRILWKRD